MRDAAVRAARGGVLTAGALRSVADTIAGALRARSALEQQDAPLLTELATGDRAVARVARGVDRPRGRGGRLRPPRHGVAATPQAATTLRNERHRVAEKMQQLVRSSGLREHLQEDFVTQRGGRPVLAVKASARRSVPGIVHDSSDSGQTLFVEPFEVVELNNHHSEVAGAEREEAERILRELSEAVGERAEALDAVVEATAQIDLTLAGAAVSRGWRGAPVEVSDDVRLLGARHPLLDPATAVPIDLELGRSARS